jgi:phosphatidylglycerol---prolipoprotein diacylglyceryl transferase
MWPDLSYIFHSIFGSQPDGGLSIVKTFGLFLTLAFLASAYILYLEFKRKEAQGLLLPRKIVVDPRAQATVQDIIWNAVFGFVIGFKFLYAWHHLDEMKGDAVAVLLSSKGDWLGGFVGALLFGAIKYWDYQKAQKDKSPAREVLLYPHQQVPDITVVAAISGILGAKIFALFEGNQSWSSFVKDPVKAFVSGSGLAIYGGLIIAFITVFYYVKKKGIKPIHVMDAVAPALIIGYAVGRLGCQFSGDGDWGIVNNHAKPSWFFLPDSWWAYTYPHNVLNDGTAIPGCSFKHCMQLTEPVYPTPLWESILAFIIFGILWILRKRITVPGVLFFIYCILNGVERFFIEKIRVNEKINWAGLSFTQAELIAFLVFIIGLVGCAVLWKKRGSVESAATAGS